MNNEYKPKIKLTNKKWTKEEEHFIINNYQKMSREEMGKILNRTTQSIANKCNHLKLIRSYEIKEGSVFGFLKVLKEDLTPDNKKHKRIYIRQRYICLCKCGKILSVSKPSLKSGKTISCGCSIWRKLPKGESSWRHLFLIYKSGAQKRNFEFNLTRKEFEKICSNNCYYCNQLPEKYYVKNAKCDTSNIAYVEHISVYKNGIDRLDSQQGYTVQNCVSCCTVCNRMKMDFSKKEFLNHIKKIYNFQNNKTKTGEKENG